MQLHLTQVALLVNGASSFISLIGLNLYGFVADAADRPYRNGGIRNVWHVVSAQRIDANETAAINGLLLLYASVQTNYRPVVIMAGSSQCPTLG